MIILASASPRRREIISRLKVDYKVITSPYNEKELLYKGDPIVYVEELAYGKALEVARLNPRDLVIGMDTVVALDGIILNKPKDKEDARRMMNLLSNRSHDVYTGFSLISLDKDIKIIGNEKTEVTFSKIYQNEIEEYLLADDWKDKAGAYGIQSDAAPFVERINGDYLNVMGFPLNRIRRELMKLGLYS